VGQKTGGVPKADENDAGAGPEHDVGQSAQGVYVPIDARRFHIPGDSEPSPGVAAVRVAERFTAAEFELGHQADYAAQQEQSKQKEILVAGQSE
jgi:hypothetical protein